MKEIVKTIDVLLGCPMMETIAKPHLPTGARLKARINAPRTANMKPKIEIDFIKNSHNLLFWKKRGGKRK